MRLLWNTINNKKLGSFHLIHTRKHPNHLKGDAPGYKICQKSLGLLDDIDALLLFHKNLANGLIYSPLANAKILLDIASLRQQFYS